MGFWKKVWRFLFLDDFPIHELTEENVIYFHETETDNLTRYMKGQTSMPASYRINFEDKTVVIETSEYTIAVLKFFYKGKNNKFVYVVVEMQDNFDGLKAWFQLAFVGKRIVFKKPTLLLLESKQVPRER